MIDDDMYEKETIDITPTWEGLLPALLMVLERGNAKGREEVLAELRRMAQIADLHVALVAEQREEAQAKAQQESEDWDEEREDHNIHKSL